MARAVTRRVDFRRRTEAALHVPVKPAPDRAGYTIDEGGEGPYRLPAAATTVTPASYARFTASAQARVGTPPMLSDTTAQPTWAA